MMSHRRNLFLNHWQVRYLLLLRNLGKWLRSAQHSMEMMHAKTLSMWGKLSNSCKILTKYVFNLFAAYQVHPKRVSSYEGKFQDKRWALIERKNFNFSENYLLNKTNKSFWNKWSHEWIKFFRYQNSNFLKRECLAKQHTQILLSGLLK